MKKALKKLGICFSFLFLIGTSYSQQKTGGPAPTPPTITFGGWVITQNPDGTTTSIFDCNVSGPTFCVGSGGNKN